MTQKTWIAAGSIALIALATAPVWAQSDNDSDDSAQNSSQNTEMQQGAQNAQQMPSDASNGPTTPPPKPPPQQADNMGQGSMQHGPAHRPGPPPPPPRGGMMAKGMPLNHVCLNKTDAYSPGAVVKMDQKPYTCKADPNDASGVLHWMPMPGDS